MDWTATLLAFAANPVVWATVAIIVWLAFLSKTKRAAMIRDAALHAYHIVEGLQQNGSLPAGLTKEAAALVKFGELLEAQDYKLTDAAVDLAKLLWASFAAQHKEIAAATVNAVARPPQ